MSAVYEVPSYVTKGSAFAHVGAESEPKFKPIREEPTVVVPDDISEYFLLVWEMINSLRMDAWKNLAWDNPLDLESEAMDLMLKAEEIDDCNPVAEAGSGSYSTGDLRKWYEEGAKGCPILTDEEDADLGEGETKARVAARTLYGKSWQAKELRFGAKVKLKFAKWLRASMSARGLKSYSPDERNLWVSIDSLRNRMSDWHDNYNRTHLVNVDEFRAVQGFDLDTQRARYQYEKFTGYAPTKSYPSYVPGGESKGPTSFLDKIPWTGILVVAGLVAVAVIAGQAAPILSVFKGKAAPTPTPSMT